MLHFVSIPNIMNIDASQLMLPCAYKALFKKHLQPLVRTSVFSLSHKIVGPCSCCCNVLNVDFVSVTFVWNISAPVEHSAYTLLASDPSTSRAKRRKLLNHHRLVWGGIIIFIMDVVCLALCLKQELSFPLCI
jgi:hypothetical protein